MSLQQVLSSDPRQFYLNDRPVTDVWSVDEEAGEITFRERHWSTGELISEPDGSPRLVTSRGKVRIEGTLPPVSSVIPGERSVPDYCYGDLPCPMCGTVGCPPSGCDNFCCLAIATLWKDFDLPLRLDTNGRVLCRCPDCQIEHTNKERRN
jgi:hypothetical protein